MGPYHAGQSLRRREFMTAINWDYFIRGKRETRQAYKLPSHQLQRIKKMLPSYGSDLPLGTNPMQLRPRKRGKG